MTTPQSILYELHYKIGAISRLIDGDEENDGIFERISQLEFQNIVKLMATPTASQASKPIYLDCSVIGEDE